MSTPYLKLEIAAVDSTTITLIVNYDVGSCATEASIVSEVHLSDSTSPESDLPLQVQAVRGKVQLIFKRRKEIRKIIIRLADPNSGILASAEKCAWDMEVSRCPVFFSHWLMSGSKR